MFGHRTDDDFRFAQRGRLPRGPLDRLVQRLDAKDREPLRQFILSSERTWRERGPSSGEAEADSLRARSQSF
jgi:hypothetical protein